MSEAEKFSESSHVSSTAQKYPAKEQVIARLVQIREYTEKAEGTLNNMPPNSQNDPKFYQLQEMIAEMRDTEQKLVDILHSYDSESPSGGRTAVDNSQGGSQSHFVGSYSDETDDDFSVLGAHAMNAVNPELLAEREKLKKRCLDSQNRIEALEKQRKYLLDACSRSVDPDKMSSSLAAASALSHLRDLDVDKRLQVVLEANSLIFSRGNRSVQGLLSSEGTGEGESGIQNLSELADKRLEIHNIISEIALLRRAKDESARKIESLQQSLKTSDFGENGLSFELPQDNSDGENSKSNDVTEGLTNDKESSNGDSSNAISGGEWMNDSFSQTITRKLVEIQSMREKLEALQSLVHDIPTPSNYQTENNGIDLNTNDVCEDPDVHAEEGGGDELFGMDDRNSDFSRQLKGGYSGRDDFTSSDLDLRRYRNHNSGKSRESDGRDDYDGASHKSFPCSSSHRLDSPARSFSVYSGREVKPVPVRPQPSAFSDTMIFPGPHRNDRHRDDSFLPRNISNNERLSGTFYDQRNEDILSVNDRIVGHPMLDAGRHWIAAAADLTNSSSYDPSGGDGTLPSNPNPNIYNSGAFEKFVTETHSMLKHIVNSIGTLSTGMANQQKQLDIITDDFGRLSERFEGWLGAMSAPGLPVVGNGEIRRNNNFPGLFTVDNKSGADMVPNISHGMGGRGNIPGEGSSFYQASRSHPNMFQEMNGGYPSGRDTKGGNPSREMWIGSASTSNAASNVNGQAEHHQNLSGYQDQMPLNSAFYNPNPAGNAKVQRPWVAHTTSMEPNRLMLNNQVPPGNRANNYWDNFRSQSRQNVLSSAAHNNVAGLSPSTNNFNRHEKNPGARPIKAVIMTHFVENIGSKKRNQEQQRQLLPQRSVSAGSMPHPSEIHNQAVAGPSRVNIRNGANDVNASASAAVFGMNKRYPNRLGERSGNKLTSKEANVLRQAQLGQDWLKDMCAKVSQLKNERIRSTTIDALRTFVTQSILQDEMESQLEPSRTDRGLAHSSNMDIRGSEQAQDSGLTQPSTSSSRSGGLNELLWLESDPFLTNSSRLLSSYHDAAAGDAVTESQAGSTSRRADLSGDMYADLQQYLSGESRLPPRSSGSSRNEPAVASSTVLSTPRRGEGPLQELWAAGMDMSFLASEPRVPSSHIHADRRNPSSLPPSAPHCRQDVVNDLCPETREAFFSNASRRPAYLIMGSDNNNPHPDIMARFHEAQKSMSGTGTKPIIPATTQPSQSAETSANNGGSNQVSSSGGSSSAAPDKDSIRSPADLKFYRQGLGAAMPPIRDSSSATDADLDAMLISVSESTNSTDPVSPEMLDLFGNSAFSNSVTYKGRSMNSTNNPWVEGPKTEDSALQPQESHLNKEEDGSVNEEVSELTEEQQPRQESPLDRNDRVI